jgi:hypothetical protein
VKALREYVRELLTEFTPVRRAGKKTLWRGMKLTAPSASVASRIRKMGKGTVESESFDRDEIKRDVLGMLRGERLGEDWSLTWSIAASFADAFGATNRGKTLHVIFEALVDEDAGYDPQAAGEEFTMFYDEDEVRFPPGTDIPLVAVYVYIAPKKDKWGFTPGYSRNSSRGWHAVTGWDYDDPLLVKV